MKFDAKKFIAEQLVKVREQIGDEKAIIACSGGVDSTVCAVLVSKAIGENLLAVYVDTGLMRKNETEEVFDAYKKMGIDLKVIHAEDDYFEALKGVTDPEKKRKIIGEKFIRIFEAEAKEFGAKFLVQGTIAPDWIESGDNGNKLVKSHHNVGGLPKKMGMKLCEPLYYLYKEDVRMVARELKIKTSERQPFPGPALSVRCLGECTPERIEIVREACFVVEREIKKAAKAGKMKLPWQYFATLLPVQSTGVVDGARLYGNTIVIRCVETKDAVKAKPSEVPFEVLQTICKKIVKEVPNVNRVVYDVTTKPPATIEWE